MNELFGEVTNVGDVMFHPLTRYDGNEIGKIWKMEVEVFLMEPIGIQNCKVRVWEPKMSRIEHKYNLQC